MRTSRQSAAKPEERLGKVQRLSARHLRTSRGHGDEIVHVRGKSRGAGNRWVGGSSPPRGARDRHARACRSSYVGYLHALVANRSGRRSSSAIVASTCAVESAACDVSRIARSGDRASQWSGPPRRRSVQRAGRTSRAARWWMDCFVTSTADASVWSARPSHSTTRRHHPTARSRRGSSLTSGGRGGTPRPIATRRKSARDFGRSCWHREAVSARPAVTGERPRPSSSITAIRH